MAAAAAGPEHSPQLTNDDSSDHWIRHAILVAMA